VRQWQTLFFGKRYASTVLDRQTDFVKLAEAFGAVGYRATTKAEFDEAFAAALSAKRPVVIDTVIGQDEFVLPMLPPGGSIDDIIVKKEASET
jgi:acetolactate synthase-1/2/3 large subunit